MDALVIKNLNYSYPDGKAALSDVNLTVQEGSRVALIGENGSGKSTLLFHINGLLDGQGYIEVMGIRRAKKNMKAIRRSIGCLLNPIEYQFIMPDLANDIMISLPERLSDKEKYYAALQWLRKFNLERYASSSPLELSSGEMKKAALAGILAREPDLLLIDEPLNNLDRASSLEILELLASMNQTMLVATHRFIAAEKLATHVAVMKGGSITGYYSAKEALALKEVKELLI
ncbi:MAG: energy-coupling factor ABC transporter ATP-binding protein [Leptospirales bacterium]|nr:energy-coupling factor ABC transporter ATP-binding protein [Leptospirales bacterium]